LHKRFISVSRNTERKYFETFVSGLIEKHHVYAEGFDIITVQEQATPSLTLHHTAGDHAQFQLSFAYGNYDFLAGAEQKISVKLQYDEAHDKYTFYRIKRSRN